MPRISMAMMALTAVALVAGCGGKEQPAPAQREMTREELIEAWMHIPEAGRDQMNVQAATAIALKLAESGPEGLEPILEVLGDPEAAPLAKVLAVASLTPLVSPEMAPRLISYTQADRDSTTRACAANLLGLLDLPAARERLHALVDDPNSQVRVAALMVLLRQGEAVALDAVRELWKDPDTTWEQRTEVVLAVPEKQAAEFLDIYRDALLDQQFEPHVRVHAATVLGRYGGAEEIPALAEAAGTDPAARVRALAQSGIELIESRNDADVPPPTADEEAQS